LAVEKGFINKNELYEALRSQQTEREGDEPPRYTGKILEDLGYMTNEQIELVLGIGGLMPLDKKQRILCKVVLSHSLKSETGKRYLIEHLGSESIEIAQNLLEKMSEK
jgi:hypothetical protein